MFNTHRTDLVSSAFTKRIVGLFRTIMCWPFVCLLVHLLNRCYTLLPSSRCVEQTYTSIKQMDTFPKSYQEEDFCGYRRQMLSGWVYGQSPSLRSIGAWFSKRKPLLQQNPAFRRWTPMWPDVTSSFFFTPLSILKSQDRENRVKYNQAVSVLGFRSLGLQVDNNS